MTIHAPRRTGIIALGLAAAACSETTSPRIRLALETQPDFGARVVSVQHQQGWAPAGFWMDQYAVWVAIAPSDTANAGVLVAARDPVFLQAGATLAPDSAADIAPGDSLAVWRDPQVVMGTAQAPPGAPAYTATQIVIVR